MKQVLAELHSLINDLEDQGLTAEASSLQDVFIRVAEEAETDDLANDVKAILESHPVAKVLEEIAKQMGGDGAGAGDEDTQTSSFANVIDSGAGEATGEDAETIKQNVIDDWKKHFDNGDLSAYATAQNATQQLIMKLKQLNIPFTEELRIKSTDFHPIIDFPNSPKPNYRRGPQLPPIRPIR